jgi:hypothetical protein
VSEREREERERDLPLPPSASPSPSPAPAQFAMDPPRGGQCAPPSFVPRRFPPVPRPGSRAAGGRRGGGSIRAIGGSARGVRRRLRAAGWDSRFVPPLPPCRDSTGSRARRLAASACFAVEASVAANPGFSARGLVGCARFPLFQLPVGLVRSPTRVVRLAACRRGMPPPPPPPRPVTSDSRACGDGYSHCARPARGGRGRRGFGAFTSFSGDVRVHGWCLVVGTGSSISSGGGGRLGSVVLLLGAPIGVLDLGAERHRIDLAKMLFFGRRMHGFVCLVHIVALG